jgi:hypothetical protein
MASASDIVRVQYNGEHAEVTVGDRTFQVARRDHEARAQTCPIELITAALGS